MWDKLKHPVYEVDVKILVYNPEKSLLFAKDTNQKWDLPGGRIDEGESLLKAVKREVKEELGVEIKSINPRPKFADLVDFDDKKQRLVVGFEVELASFDFKKSDENIEDRFLSSAEFDVLNSIYDGLKKIKHYLYVA
jgi:8-oxo-dGTP pyrophosphatase MutT (NUDIX family)